MTRRGVLPLLIALATLLAGCTGEEPSQIQVAEVTRASVSEIVEAPGTIAARATATLRAPAAGTIAKLYVQDGDKVKKGDLLAKIDSPQAREQLKQARAAEREASRPVRLGGPAPAVPAIRLSGAALTGPLDREARQGFAAARRAAAKVTDARARKELLAAIDVAQRRHEAQRAALVNVVNGLNRSVNGVLAQVSGQVGAGLDGLAQSMSALQAASRSQARALVASAEATVKALTIKAPFDGVVTLGGPAGGGADLGGLLSQLPAGVAGGAGSLPAPPTAGSGGGTGTIAVGVPVSAGEAIVTVTDVSRLTLSADVDETDVLLVQEGTRAEAELDAVPGAAYPAEVTGVGVTPKEGTTGGVSYAVRLALGKGRFSDGSPAPTPKPGMSAVIRLTVRESPDAVAVPASAIVTSGRETVVWAVRPDGTAERRAVRLGAEGESQVEVLSGVTPGERIVVRGADAVRPGQQVP